MAVLAIHSTLLAVSGQNVAFVAAGVTIVAEPGYSTDDDHVARSGTGNMNRLARRLPSLPPGLYLAGRGPWHGMAWE